MSDSLPKSKKKDAQQQQSTPQPSEAEKSFNEFITSIGILIKTGQLQQLLRADPNMQSLLGPNVYNGLLAAMQGQSKTVLSQLMGHGNAQWVEDASKAGPAGQEAQLSKQAMEGQADVNRQYEQAMQAHQKQMQNLTGPQQALPQYMQPQAWAAVRGNLPWYQQQALLNAPNTFNPSQVSSVSSTKAPSEYTQMQDARKTMTQEQQERFDQMMSPEKEK